MLYVSGCDANAAPSIATPLNPFSKACLICFPVTTAPLPDRTRRGFAGLSDGQSTRDDNTPLFFQAAHSAFDTADDPTEKSGSCCPDTPSNTSPIRSRCCSRSEEHTSELQSREKVVCRLLLEKRKL